MHKTMAHRKHGLLKVELQIKKTYAPGLTHLNTQTTTQYTKQSRPYAPDAALDYKNETQ